MTQASERAQRRLMLVVPWTAVGGADKFNLDLIVQLNRRGWETTVVTTRPGDHSWLPQFEQVAAETFPLPQLVPPEEYAGFLGGLIESRKPDAILLAHSEFAYAALPYLRRVAGEAPIVDYCHVVEEYWRRGGHPALSVENRHLLDFSITASQQIKDWMVSRGVEPDRAGVCYINIERRSPVEASRESLDLPADVPLILYPCRLVFQKQPHVFAKTMLELDRRGCRFLAVAVGDGPYLPWLQSFVARHSLEHCVRLLGYRPHSTLQELLSLADCVFLPSSSEGIALVLYEAMATGVAVVAADVGGQRELVTDDCGVLVQRSDEATEVDRYASALAGLLGDPLRCRELGAAGRARIEGHFTLDLMGERMDALLERARELARARPRELPTLEEAEQAALGARATIPPPPPLEPEPAVPGSAPSGPPFVVDIVLPSIEPTGQARGFLEALEAQTYPHFRLIVVDRNSDDRLDEVFAGFKPFPILHLHADASWSDARRIGLAHCDADAVAIPREDCRYPPDLLERAVDLLRRNRAWSGVIGRTVTVQREFADAARDPRAGRVTWLNVWDRVDGAATFFRGSALRGRPPLGIATDLGPEEEYLEDLGLLLPVLLRRGRVHHDPSLEVVGPPSTRPPIRMVPGLWHDLRRRRNAVLRGDSGAIVPDLVIDAVSHDFASTPVAADRAPFEYLPATDAGGEPCLSIMTPFFDTDPALFEQTIACVRGQSLQNFEWVIVDDGSTRADSVELLAASAAADPRIRIVRHDRNRGVVAARNTGLASVKTDFVLQLDSDDLLEPTAAEKWLWFLVSHPEYAFVNSYQVGFGNEEYLWPRGFEEREVFLRENLTNPGGIARTNLFAAVGAFDESLTDGLEDWELWLRAAASGHWGATIPEFLKWHRRKGGDNDRWPNWDGGARQQELLAGWRRRYPKLWAGQFPTVAEQDVSEVAAELTQLPFENPLAKSKRRLLLIVPWATMGGSDKFNVDLVEQLARRDWEVTIVTTLFGDHTRLPQLAAQTPDTFALSHFLKPADFARCLKYLVESRSPDAIVISHSRFAYEALPYLRRVAGAIPIVDYSHVVEPGWLEGGYPRLSVGAGSLLDLRIASSDDLRSWMIDQGATPESVAVCHTNIDPTRSPAANLDAFDLPPDRPLILYPCRICDQKQPAVFAKSLQELRRRGEDFLALVAGDGPDLPWLEGYVRRSGLTDHVRFLGRQPNHVVDALMQRADIVFLPSKYEGIALTLFEAMAAGTPVVAADVGGQRELVTPDCGVLLANTGDEDSDAASYAAALAGLLHDSERRHRMGQAARARIATSFTLDQMGERMDGLVERARALVRAQALAVPSLSDAREGACMAIRHARWQWSRGRGGPSPGIGGYLRVWLLTRLAMVGRPVYRLARRRGYRWLDPLKNGLVRLLLRHD